MTFLKTKNSIYRITILFFLTHQIWSLPFRGRRSVVTFNDTSLCNGPKDLMPETQGSCDFEHNNCGYTLTGQWQRTKNVYGIADSASGIYISPKTSSWPYPPHNRYYIISPKSPAGKYCLQFMYAASDTDSNLDVKVYDGTSDAYIKLWSISKGHASTSWTEQSLVFDTDTQSKLTFAMTKTNSYKTIGLDNIKLWKINIKTTTKSTTLTTATPTTIKSTTTTTTTTTPKPTTKPTTTPTTAPTTMPTTTPTNISTTKPATKTTTPTPTTTTSKPTNTTTSITKTTTTPTTPTTTSTTTPKTQTTSTQSTTAATTPTTSPTTTTTTPTKTTTPTTSTTQTTTPTTIKPTTISTTTSTTIKLTTTSTTINPATTSTTIKPTTTSTTTSTTIKPTTTSERIKPTTTSTTTSTTTKPTTTSTTRKETTSTTTKQPTTTSKSRKPTTTPTKTTTTSLTLKPTTRKTTTLPTTTIPLTLATYAMSFIGFYNPSGHENVPIASCDTYYSRVLYEQLTALKPILENSCQRNLSINTSTPLVLHQSSKNMTMSVEVYIIPTNESEISIACHCEGSITYHIQRSIKTAISHQQTPYCPWIHMPTEKHEMQKQRRGHWSCNDGRTLPNSCESGTIQYCNK